MRAKKLFISGIAVGILMLGAIVPAMADEGKPVEEPLVNVQVEDITVAVPVAIAANLCDVNANILSKQIRIGETKCEATAVAVVSLPDDDDKKKGGDGHEAGDALVNVQIGDITIVAAVAIAANICDVNVNYMSEQLRIGDTTCEATAVAVVSLPDEKDKDKKDGGGHEAGDALVNVQTGDVTVILAVAIAVNVCDVNFNYMSEQIRIGDTKCEATAVVIADLDDDKAKDDKKKDDIKDPKHDKKKDDWKKDDKKRDKDRKHYDRKPVHPGHHSGESLVNVQTGDITLLVPVAIAANLCDVNANILSRQLRIGETTCEATAIAVASADDDGKDRGRHGRWGGMHGHRAGPSPVNVQVGDVTLLMPLAAAANVCDVNANFLAEQIRVGGAHCTAAAKAIAAA